MTIRLAKFSSASPQVNMYDRSPICNDNTWHALENQRKAGIDGPDQAVVHLTGAERVILVSTGFMRVAVRCPKYLLRVESLPCAASCGI